MPGGPRIYVYAIDPPYSASTLEKAVEGARQFGIEYGQAMLKVSVLLGWEPVLAEYQIIDSTAVLQAGADEHFYELVRGGFIHLSYFRRAPTYWDSLARFLEGGGITSAWGKVGAEQMLRNLRAGATRATADWGDDAAGQMIEGLLRLDALRANLQGRVRRTSGTFSLHSRAKRLIDEVFPPQSDANSQIGANVKQLLFEIASRLPEREKGLRSRWIDEIHKERYSGDSNAGYSQATVEAAVTAITLAFNEEATRVVGGGAALRSTALTAVGYNDSVSQILGPAEALQGAALRTDGKKAKGGIAIPIRASLPSIEDDLQSIVRIPWTAVHAVVSHPTFRVRIDKANSSPTGREAFLAWVEDQLGLAMKLESLAESSERIVVGSELLRKLPPVWALETLSRALGKSSKWDKALIGYQATAKGQKLAGSAVGALRRFSVPAALPKR